MTELRVTSCPNCDLIARGEEEIEELFGWRKGDRPQSWCRACRIEASAKRRKEIRGQKEAEEKAKTEEDNTDEVTSEEE